MVEGQKPVLKSKRLPLSWFEPRACWRKMIGGRVFYFSGSHDDYQDALQEARAIRETWRAIRATGAVQWPDGQPNREAIRSALGIVRKVDPVIAAAVAASLGRVPPAAPQDAPAVRRVAVGGLTLADAAKIYLAARNKEAVGTRTLDDVRHRLAKAIELIGEANPLNTINQTVLETFSGTVQKSYSHVHARNLVAATKAFLNWCAEHDQIAWQKPKRFDDILSVKKDKARTEAQRDAKIERVWGNDERHWDLAELGLVFRAADPRMRAWIMLALNTAFTPIEICRLKNKHIKSVRELTRIQTIRGKTDVPCQFPLWPETIKAIDETRSSKAPEEYVWLSESGKPILEKNLQSKYFSRTFASLKRKLQLTDAPDFRHLRHTSANEIKKIAGGEISEIHLAHMEGLRMQGPYTDRLWEQHSEAVTKLREVFKPVWS